MRPITPFYTRYRAAILGAIVIGLLIGYAAGHAIRAHASQPKPIPAPPALLKARAACPNHATPVRCRTALRKAYAGLAWAKKERRHRWAPTVEYAIALACASQPDLDCGWLKRMISCESGRDPFSKNRHSTARGLAQFLRGTWSGNRYSRFSVTDPIANALGAAWLAIRNGYGPWYASRGCWRR